MFLELSMFKQQLLFKQNRRFVFTALLSRSRNSKPVTFRWWSVILMAPGFRQPEHLADLPIVFLVKNQFSSESELNLSALLTACKILLLWWRKMFLDVRVFLRESLGLSREIHYPQILLSPNVGLFCLSNKCSSNARWCDNLSLYLPFSGRNNRSRLFLLFLHCNLSSDILSVSGFFPNLVFVVVLESDLPVIFLKAF